MCLVTISEKPKIAEEFIICYKVLVSTGGILHTPYRGFLFEPKVTYNDGAEESITPFKKYSLVEGGFFHAYLDKEYAKKTLASIVTVKGEKAVLYKAIIPEGTKYYTGLYKDICAKSLKITEECD